MKQNFSKSIALIFGIAAFIGLVRNSVAESFEQRLAELAYPTMTHDAFARAELRLKNLQPGDLVTDDVLGLNYYQIKKNGLFSSESKLVAVADGWIPAMSGSGRNNLGRAIGLENGFVFGRHIYGYVYGNVTLVPKYVLVTKAARVTEAEYQEMKKSGKHNNIRRVRFGEGERAYYFNDNEVRMVELRQLQFQGLPDLSPDDVTIKASDYVTVRGNLEAVYKEANYKIAEAQLNGMKQGTDSLEMIHQLKGIFISKDFGQSYMLFMNGYANFDGDNRWQVATDNAAYEVWPFGHVEGNTEVVKLNVIFRNSKLSHAEAYESKKTLAPRLLAQP